MAARGLDIDALRVRRHVRAQPRLLHGLHLRDCRTRAARTASRSSAAAATTGLLQHLGAAAAIPAVGCSFWLDRIVARRAVHVATRPLDPGRPSKGRLQENAAAFFARAGLVFAQSRGARDYRGSLAGVPDVEVALPVRFRDRRAARNRRCASRRHRRGSRARADRRCRRGGRDADAARLRTRQRRRRRAAGLDRRAHDGRSRRGRGRPARPPRPQDARRDEIREPHAPLLRREGHRRLPDRREPRRDRGCAGGRLGGAHRRHHDDRRRRSPRTPSRSWTTA